VPPAIFARLMELPQLDSTWSSQFRMIPQSKSGQHDIRLDRDWVWVTSGIPATKSAQTDAPSAGRLRPVMNGRPEATWLDDRHLDSRISTVIGICTC
jgi:hypothetical protein